MGNMVCTEEKRNTYRVFGGETLRKGALARPRRRCDDDIKIALKEIGWGVVDWINLAQVEENS